MLLRLMNWGSTDRSHDINVQEVYEKNHMSMSAFDESWQLTQQKNGL